MGMNKLQRFAENETFPHLFQPSFEEVFRGDFALKGEWHARVFKNGNPITLELGCGRGEYTVALADRFPARNFIGMDIKGARLWYGAKESFQKGMGNVAFARGRIETVTSFFGANEIDEIWITFPDPQLKDRRAKKRLTAHSFLLKYAQFLRPEGVIHLKTDSQELHAFTLEVLSEIGTRPLEAYTDIDPIMASRPELQIPTRYEREFRAKGKSITYLSFQLTKEALLALERMMAQPGKSREEGNVNDVEA